MKHWHSWLLWLLLTSHCACPLCPLLLVPIMCVLDRPVHPCLLCKLEPSLKSQPINVEPKVDKWTMSTLQLPFSKMSLPSVASATEAKVDDIALQLGFGRNKCFLICNDSHLISHQHSSSSHTITRRSHFHCGACNVPQQQQQPEEDHCLKQLHDDTSLLSSTSMWLPHLAI